MAISLRTNGDTQMKIIREFYRLIQLIEELICEVRTHRRAFDEYKYNLNQIPKRS